MLTRYASSTYRSVSRAGGLASGAGRVTAPGVSPLLGTTGAEAESRPGGAGVTATVSTAIGNTSLVVDRSVLNNTMPTNASAPIVATRRVALRERLGGLALNVVFADGGGGVLILLTRGADGIADSPVIPECPNFCLNSARDAAMR